MEKETKLMICSYDEKIKYLKKWQHDDTFHSVKFMTKEEYFQHAFFSYDEKALEYIMKKYHLCVDVAKVYLKSLYLIEEDESYQNSKLQFLQKLKVELKDQNLLLFSPHFLNHYSDKEIVEYYEFDSYEEKVLPSIPKIEDVTLNHPVYEFLTIEEEIHFVCQEIIKLRKKGVPFSKIFVFPITEEYEYPIEKIFSYYHIPLQLRKKDSIYSTKMVQDYLKGERDLESLPNNEVTRFLFSCIQKVSTLKEGKVKQDILIDLIQNTTFSPKNKNSVKEKNIYEVSIEDDEYIFILGMNQDRLPEIQKDNEYLTDSDKKELDSYPTEYLNKRKKRLLAMKLQKAKNVFLSYKLKTSFEEYYPSSFIEEYQLPVIKDYNFSYKYSHLYNKIHYKEMIDNYDMYGTKEEKLDSFYQTYQNDITPYQNQFKGISHDTYLEKLPYPLTLSYTSLNTYHECKFKYYVEYVLSLKKQEPLFSSYIGTLFHHLLALYRNPNFNFEEEWKKYQEKKELSFKEQLLLVRIKKEFLTFLEELKKQDQYSQYGDILYEEKMVIPIKGEVSVQFEGYIDKIMMYRQIEDTYFSIIDYKTGKIDTSLEPMKYGLHMQLPVYLYLIHYSKVIPNPIFTGLYYQTILFPYVTWSKKNEKEKKERYLLKGYSTNDLQRLERFDSTYQESQMIEKMKYSEEKGIDSKSKLFSDEDIYHMVRYTKDIIEKSTKEIIEGDFRINPKIYDNKNISCKYCPYQDLCYYEQKDKKYLNKVEDLSFLGGEES